MLFYEEEGGVVVYACMFSAGGRFYARDDLNGVYTLLANRVVNCTFAQPPFAAQKNSRQKHNVLKQPEYAHLVTDPPVKITAKLGVRISVFITLRVPWTLFKDS